MTDERIAAAEEMLAAGERGNAVRKALRAMPGRGNAPGGFIGPFRISALTAWDPLKERGIDVDIVFHD